ncbi:MAG: hypothetical protein IPK22_04445 [Verrucomicrobiaceae bacterium]|nr:hypothetical protein [Verrucomicrobiaceae bacterium]
MKIAAVLVLLLATCCHAQDAATLAAREANQHAFELFQLFRQMTKGNFCFSPYSGHRVAAMLAEGAKGDTQKELLAMAHLARDMTERAAQAAALRQELSKAAGKGLILEIANSIWMPQSHSFDPAFVSMAQEQFGAAAQTLPEDDPTKSAAIVNRWIRDRTRGRITSLVGPGVFTGDDPTALVINAVYLKAAWESPFEFIRTKPRSFTQSSGSTSLLSTMQQTSAFEYGDSEAWQCLELPFLSGEFSMRFLLPRLEENRPTIEKSLSSDTWDKVTSAFTNCDVNVLLPRFGFSTQLDLKGLWQYLGASNVFDRDKCDLTNMIAQRPCWTRQILHEATIEVNEIGAEASAATAAANPFAAGEPPKRRRVSFIANHPFLWVIQHRRTGLILFMGRFAGE